MTLIDGDIIIFSLTAAIIPGPSRRRGDFMATVLVRASQIHAEYRFRWHNTAHKLDMDGGPDDDEKSFYALGPVDDSPEDRLRIKNALRKLTTQMPGFARVHEQEGEWTPEKFILEVMDQSPMMTQITPERS